MLEDSSGREAGGGSYDPGEDLRAFFMRRGDMGAKAWSKATAEQRAKHRASCIEAGRERKLQNFAAKHLCLLYTSPSPRDGLLSRMPSSA